MDTSDLTALLPGFIAEEQARRQQERRQMILAVKSLTKQGRHREAVELWNTHFEEDRAA
jgi:hypothetical protein